MKVRDVVREIEKDGWRFYSQKGSHRQYVHPVKGGRVTIAGKPGDDMHPKTLASVYRQAQIGIAKETDE
ncbi:MAG TPA: type II toxin-antitoxin system HicA family toxin [Bryobacteraceae bacterium]